MPNIEIHGFGPCKPKSRKWTTADHLFKVIRNCFNEEPFGNDYVVTIFNSVCLNGKNKEQPFIRICSSESAHTKRIIKILQQIQKNGPVKFDIEVHPIKKFIPAEK
jgi:hypothetical protein